MNEFLCKRPRLVMLSFWMFGLGFYIPMCFIFGVKKFSPHIAFSSKYLVSFFNVLTWFLPLVATAIVSWIFLRKLSLRTQQVTRSNRFVSIEHLKEVKTRLKRHFLKGDANEDEENDYKLASNSNISSFHLEPTTKFKIIMCSFWIQWIIP
jgi:hypothetical protein